MWTKRGLIFAPPGDLWWARTGAQLPTVTVPGDDIIRVYFGSKDDEGFGRTGRIDLDAENPQKIVDIATEPTLDLGELGAFDDCGAVPNCVTDFNGKSFLYYQGFQRTERVPYLTFTGLAIGAQGDTSFKKYSRTPIMERTDEEPFIRSTPCVIFDEGILKMWYVSTVKWTRDQHGVHYICVVRYATSVDGVNWETHEHVCLEPDLPEEYAVGRPSVIRDGDRYRMWYSIRSFTSLYDLGYAESADGITWERKDELAGIRKSESGWDSEMICYPCVIESKGRRLMFYNGNGRGICGFGYATLDE
jgi:predicted GH43/DUF377 family glycosyl hydrolase